METSGPERTDAGECCRFPYTAVRAGVNASEVAELDRRAADCRRGDADFAAWAGGQGPIAHDTETQVRIHALAHSVVAGGAAPDRGAVYRLLAAADRITAAAMWLVAHMTYARHVYRDGRPLAAEDFKPTPEGHTGGALNIVPAYVGYLAANALTGHTRSWLMGQGHCVAGIDAVNLFVGNLSPAHAERYGVDDAGLTRFVRDFYSYAVRADGAPDSPLGSHVNVHTAGGLIEGGYLGFAELQYPHIPLAGERLVAFLSDGAFEEQRGADWTARWWRAEDCGLVVPVMILNGRRIEQRTQMDQSGGVAWFMEHLRLNGFDPVVVDGRDPAAIAWAIVTCERALEDRAAGVSTGALRYPIPIPYAIAETVKGYGFPGAGTNAAHNLPLGANPRVDTAARQAFNEGARRLFVPAPTIAAARATLGTHAAQGRPLERDHPAAVRHPPLPALPPAPWRLVGADAASPTDALDEVFVGMVAANPGLRPRVGNPDELRSNGLVRTLERLKHRAAHPEPGIAESLHGGVITALNEEAVVSAALANKGGLNLVVTYEAFAVKMLGAIRQELIFARHQLEAGSPPGWLAVPVIATSHTWENGKNEQSHQDPTFCEALLGEMSDCSRVTFPADANSAIATLQAAYRSRGCIWTLVVPKRPVPSVLNPAMAAQLVADGAIRLRGSGAASERVILGAVGAYQLVDALRASDRLNLRGVAHALVYLAEPGRFRAPRDEHEARHATPPALREALFPVSAPVRVWLVHTRPEPFLGTVRPLDTGDQRTRVLGYINRGGTLDTAGMQFANRVSWAHALRAVAEGLETDPRALLTEEELAAIEGRGDPLLVMRRPGNGARVPRQ